MSQKKQPDKPTAEELQRRLEKLTPVMQHLRGLTKDLREMAKEAPSVTTAHAMANIATATGSLADQVIEIRSGEGTIAQLKKEGLHGG